MVRRGRGITVKTEADEDPSELVKAKERVVTPALFTELTPGFFTSGALAASGFGGTFRWVCASLRAVCLTRFFSGFCARPLTLGFRARDFGEFIYLCGYGTKGGADGGGN